MHCWNNVPVNRGLVCHCVSYFPIRQRTIGRLDQLDREARRLGQNLLPRDEEDEDGDYDDYDDDVMDMEASNIIFTSLLR